MSHSGERPVDLGILEEYQRNAAQAKNIVGAECRELNYAIGSEVLADINVWSQSLYYIGKAAITTSADPLVEGAPYIQSSLYTMPIIGPLIAERRESGKTFKRIRGLQAEFSKDPETAYYSTENIEIEALLESDKKTAPHGHAPRSQDGFALGLLKDWSGNFRPINGMLPIIQSSSQALFNMVSIPFVNHYEMDTREQTRLQYARVLASSKSFQASIDLKIDSEDGSLTINYNEMLDDEERYKEEKRKSGWMLASSGAATLCASGFIINETKQAAKYTSSMLQETETDSVVPVEDHTMDGISSLCLSVGMILAHLLPATLTLSPLKEASKKFSDHYENFVNATQRLNMISFLKSRHQGDKDTSFTYHPDLDLALANILDRT